MHRKQTKQDPHRVCRPKIQMPRNTTTYIAPTQPPSPGKGHMRRRRAQVQVRSVSAQPAVGRFDVGKRNLGILRATPVVQRCRLRCILALLLSPAKKTVVYPGKQGLLICSWRVLVSAPECRTWPHLPDGVGVAWCSLPCREAHLVACVLVNG